MADSLKAIRPLVDARLAGFFEAQRADIDRLAPSATELLHAIESLTMRGGKRLRPILLAAAFRAVHEEGELASIVDAGAALELLQSYLLIHDDIMDRDEERRGGPTAHVMLRDAHGGDAHRGVSLGILAGDLAFTYGWQLLLAAPFPADRRDEALATFVRAQVEVYFGQHLDVTGDLDTPRMHDLKTGSYTVRLPLRLGALLGNATGEQLAALLAFGNPLGEAFQLRDDVLGTFGDPKEMGKPNGGDVRLGKRTALVRELEPHLKGSDRAVFERAFGNPDAPDDAVAAVAELYVTHGARARVEERLRLLYEESCQALRRAPLAPAGTSWLEELAALLAMRTS